MMKVTLCFIPVSSLKVLGFPWEQDYSLPHPLPAQAMKGYFRHLLREGLCPHAKLMSLWAPRSQVLTCVKLHPVRVLAVAVAAVNGRDGDGGKALHTETQEERLNTALEGIQQREPGRSFN